MNQKRYRGESLSPNCMSLGTKKARVIDHLQAIHEEAYYISYDCKVGRILRYLRYRWNLHVKEVRYGQHANLYQEFYHTNNTYHVAFSTGHRVAEQYGDLAQRVVLLFALAHSDVGLHCHKLNDGTAFEAQKASHSYPGDTAYYKLQSHLYGNDSRDDYDYLPLPYVHDAISYFSGLPLPYEHDDTHDALKLRSLYAFDNTVYVCLAPHLFDSDSVPYFSQIGTFYIVPVQQRSRQMCEEKIVCKNYIASEGCLEVEYHSWQSSNLCHHASGVLQHSQGQKHVQILNKYSTYKKQNQI